MIPVGTEEALGANAISQCQSVFTVSVTMPGATPTPAYAVRQHTHKPFDCILPQELQH